MSVNQRPDEVMLEQHRELCLQNLKLVDYVIHNKLHIHTNAYFYEDLQQEGRLALCFATLRYQPELGYKFNTYACSYIYFQLLAWLNNSLPLYKIPRVVNDHKSEISKIKEENPDITNEQIAKLTGLSQYEIAEVNNIQNYVSIDEQVNDGENPLTYGEVLPDTTNLEDMVYEKVTLDQIDQLLDKINYSKEIHYLIFQEYIYDRVYGGIKLSQEEYAEKYGVSRTHVHRILSRYTKEFKRLIKGE